MAESEYPPGAHDPDTGDAQHAAQHPEPLDPDEELGEIDPNRAITVPFSEDDTSITVVMGLHGPAGAVELPYLLDTAASYTTITTSAAQTLGIAIPPDAPTLTFNTSAGALVHRMVYVPAVSIGDARIEGLTASVCDACARSQDVQGLLGINVLREFVLEMDYGRHQLRLLPRQQRPHPNRAADAEVMTRLEIDGTADLWQGHFRWVVRVENRSTVALGSVVPYVEFDGAGPVKGDTIERIEPGAAGSSVVEGDVTAEVLADSGGHYVLGLARAHWLPERAR